MNETYHLKLQDGQGYEALVAISGNISLYGLAEHLLDTIGFDMDHAFGFYDGLQNPYHSKEKYTLFADMGESEDGEPGVHQTFIPDVFEPGKQMIFLFDYGDDWHFLITCTGIEEPTSKRKVRKVISETGTPPEQYPDCDDE